MRHVAVGRVEDEDDGAAVSTVPLPPRLKRPPARDVPHLEREPFLRDRRHVVRVRARRERRGVERSCREDVRERRLPRARKAGHRELDARSLGANEDGPAWSSKASVGVERRRGRGLKPRRGRRETTGKVLKERRSPRRRGRMGTSVDTTARARGGGAGGGTGHRRTAGDGVVRAERATRLRIHSMRRSQGPMARVGDAGSGGGVVVFETRSEKLRSAPEIVQLARGQQRASQRARLKELARRAHLAAHRGRSTRDRRGTRSGRARRTRDVDFMAAKPYTLCARAPSPRRRRRRRLQNDRSLERAIDRPTHDAIPPSLPLPPPAARRPCPTSPRRTRTRCARRYPWTTSCSRTRSRRRSGSTAPASSRACGFHGSPHASFALTSASRADGRADLRALPLFDRANLI